MINFVFSIIIITDTFVSTLSILAKRNSPALGVGSARVGFAIIKGSSGRVFISAV
jgi:hypothetical protein